MISRIHSKLGTAGLVVAIVALVAALGGGAYAAQQGLNGKQKKEVKKIAKKFAGKPGATGAQGPKGDTGAAGPAGKDGTNGTNGADGADGADGEPGMCSAEEPECSLAPGGVLTGVWSAAGGEDDLALASISFPVRVSPAPVAVYPFKLAGAYNVGYEVEDGKKTLVGPYPCVAGCAGEGAAEQADPTAAFEEAQAAYLEACPGDAAEPEATAGVLCIYVKDRQGGLADPVSTLTGSLSESAHEFGVTLAFEINAPDSYTRGSWAVAG